MTVAGRFVKCPVEVEAVRFEHQDQAPLIVGWVDDDNAVYLAGGGDLTPPAILLDTLHGVTRVRLGDWIVRGPGGDYWPNTADEFERNYAPVGVASADA